MKLIVGLGNPGKEYALNRHNVGFMAVDKIVHRHNFLASKKKFSAEVFEGRLGLEKVILLKPLTYMNLSGQSVGEAMRFYKLDASDVIVLYDEIDLPAGKYKVKQGGGVAGHNGLKSMTQHIGADYHRVRIGVGRPQQKSQVANYVLGNFAKADYDWLDPLLDSISQHAEQLTYEKLADFKKSLDDDLQPKSQPKPKKKAEVSDDKKDKSEAKPASKIEAPKLSAFEKLAALKDKFK